MRLLKLSAWFFIIFILSPLLVWYFTNIGRAALWIWAWLILWFVFINAKWDELTKGLLLIVGSCWIAVGGRTLVHEVVPVLDALQNMMLLIGGGVGGNFIYAFLAKKQAAKLKKN